MAVFDQVTFLFVLSGCIITSAGKDCGQEANFYSNLSIESWCRTGIDECSLGSLKSRFPPLFNATGWAPGKPELLRITTYCRNDSRGEKQGGVDISWRPPLHSGARDIKGFEIRLEGYRPGYKCTVIRLMENLTQPVTHRTVNGTIFPIHRNQHYYISLFSLPRSDYSGRVSQSFKSLRCENNSGSWNWRPKSSEFYITYNDDKKELYVSFPSPPSHFNLTEFIVTVVSGYPHYKIVGRVTINQTRHVFTSVEEGQYTVSLEPYNPYPFDKKLCKCRSARNKCKSCLRIDKYFTATKVVPLSTTLLPKKKRKWTTKVVIKKFKKDKKPKKDKTDKKIKKVMVKIVLPIFLFIISCVAITIGVIFALRRIRKSKQITKTKTDTVDKSKHSEGDQVGRHKKFLIFLDSVNPGTRIGGSSFQTEFFEIVKGILGQYVTLHKLDREENLEGHLRDYLKRLCNKHGKVTKDIGTKDIVMKDHDCSETCLLESRPSSKSRFQLDCCLNRVGAMTNIVLCIFVSRNMQADVLQSLKNVFAALAIPSDNVEITSLCVCETKEDMPNDTSGMKVFGYKDELPILLNYIKELLPTENRRNNLEKRHGSSSVFINNIGSCKHFINDITEPYIEAFNDHDIDGQWIDLPDGVHIARGPWLDSSKRKRYVSSDSGWGASEHSFRSTPIEEANENSSKSSLQSISEPEHSIPSEHETNQNCSPPRVQFSNSAKPLLSDTSSPLVRPEPMCSIVSSSPAKSLTKCPSEVFFFPPDDLKSLDTDQAKVRLGEYCSDTGLRQLEYVPCKNFNKSPKVVDKLKNRQSPSIDSLMDMLKTINDESTHYMEHEADIGEVHSVFQGVV